MKKRIITNQTINSFKDYLIENEKATATIEKYVRDIHLFVEYATDKPLDKPLVLEYKTSLEQIYAIRSANSMLAALNSFFRFLGWHDLCVKQFKVQKETYCSEEKELTKAEYTFGGFTALKQSFQLHYLWYDFQCVGMIFVIPSKIELSRKFGITLFSYIS